MDRKAFTVRLPPDLVKALRIQAIKEERRTNEIIEDVLSRYLMLEEEKNEDSN